MRGLLARALERLHAEDVRYLVLRDAERLPELCAGGEVDLLVAPADLPRLRRGLVGLGFAALPGLGYAPHRFYVGYDPGPDAFVKLDVVDRLWYGRPFKVLRTELAGRCLAGRRWRDPVFVPAPEEELVALLLHCLLDKAALSPPRAERLRELVRGVDEAVVTELLRETAGPALSWQHLARAAREGDGAALLAAAPAIRAHLMARDPIGTRWRALSAPLRRRLGRLAGRLVAGPPGVALLAPDGAGKSTLAAALTRSFPLPVRTVYMGLYPRTEPSRRRSRLPGLGLPLRLGRLWARWIGARWHRARGRIVIFDRYAYDALLAPRRALPAGKRLRRLLLGRACPAPDLVVVLDAPGEVLFSRKGEHDARVLEEQRQEYLRLAKGLPRSVVVDATREPEAVRREVVGLVWREFAGRLATGGTA